MKTQHLFIETIPAVLYGENAERGYLFLHGQMGRKEEAESFAQLVCPKGYQVLSIDLPAHGERQNREEELTPWRAVPDIRAAKDWAMQRWNSYSVRATSIGAYFAMLALEDPDRALLLSPIVDMEDLILTMLGWAGTTAGAGKPWRNQHHFRADLVLEISLLGAGACHSPVDLPHQHPLRQRGQYDSPPQNGILRPGAPRRSDRAGRWRALVPYSGTTGCSEALGAVLLLMHPVRPERQSAPWQGQRPPV